MRDEHIIAILESAPLARLGADELETVRTHAARCAECLRAYEAARVSSVLLKERASVAAASDAAEMPPFFQTRVLAALRERRAAEEAPALRRLWRAAGALVSSMAVTVAALVLLTFTVPGTPATQETSDALASSELSADDAALLVAQDDAEGEIDYEQVLTSIYGVEDARVDDGQNR